MQILCFIQSPVCEDRQIGALKYLINIYKYLFLFRLFNIKLS